MQSWEFRIQIGNTSYNLPVSKNTWSREFLYNNTNSDVYVALYAKGFCGQLSKLQVTLPCRYDTECITCGLGFHLNITSSNSVQCAGINMRWMFPLWEATLKNP